MMNEQELKNKIELANKTYREGKPVMSDTEFDILLEQYEKLVDKEAYDAFRNSLHEVEGKVKHPFVLGSLNKLKAEEPENVKSFINDNISTSLNVSAKVDGISCRIYYKNRKLISASTRGNGYFGENLTDKIIFVKNVLQKIDFEDDIDIRGELVILKDDFKKISDKFANPRNATAGIMNKKEWTESEVSLVTFIPYTVLGPKYNKSEQFKIIEKFGFKSAWHVELSKVDANASNIVDKLLEYVKQDFEYEVDGLVLSDSTYTNEDAYRPEKQVAFKSNQLVAETTLIDIDWSSLSKDGYVCPVAILEPVELGGSTISRASVYNLDFIKDMNLKYGSRVSLMKSGDIIPKILEVLENPEDTQDIELPAECPCCGSTLVRDGVNLRCMNKDCKDQVVMHIMFFIKKLGVKNCSFATLDNFGIHSFEDLVKFVPDNKYKMQVKLYDELKDKVFTKSKQDLLAAMNFKDVGETLINKIIDFYGLENVENLKFNGFPKGIGETTLQKFKDVLLENLNVVNMIIQDSRYNYSKNILDDSEVKHSNKNGMSVCFTGKLFTMTRNDASKKAEEAGFEVKGGVNKGLTYLVTNDTETNSSKNRKAKELRIKVINEEEFLKLLTENVVQEDLTNL